MHALLEGSQEIKNILFPKQISTYDDKSILGIYLRDRIGGLYNRRITLNDLKAYGRTDITVTKLSIYDYFFDFHV